MASAKKYDEGYKKQAIKLAKELGSAKKAATELGISSNTLYGWLKKYDDGEIEVAEVKRSPEEVIHLTDEIQQLKKQVKEQAKEIHHGLIVMTKIGMVKKCML